MGERRRREAAAIAEIRGLTFEEAVKLPREDVLRLIEDAGATVLDWTKLRGNVIPGGEFDIASVEIARRGAPFAFAARAADLVAKAIGENPRMLISLMVGGFEDDPRELMDIPEALKYFAAYGERLQAIDAATSPQGSRPMLLGAHDELSRMLMLVGLGVIPRERVQLNVVPWDDPSTGPRLAAEVERAKALGAQHMEDEATAAKGATKQ
jgi:hypothetical protein